MNIQQFKYILEIYQRGSINKAAQSLFISQPALSMAVKELEDELGFAIFERSKKGVRPTPAGSEFLNTIRDVIQNMDSIQKKYISSEKTDNQSVILRIATSRYSFFCDALKLFLDRSIAEGQKYSISIEEIESQNVIDSLINRRIDLGLLHFNSQGISSQLAYFRDNHVKPVFLFNSGPSIAFRRGHELEKYDSISKEMLSAYPQIRMSDRNFDYYNWDYGFSFRSFPDCGKNFFISSRGCIYDMIGLTDAIYFMTTNKGFDAKHPNICVRPLDVKLQFSFYAITQEYNSKEYVNVLINTIRDYCMRSELL